MKEKYNRWYSKGKQRLPTKSKNKNVLIRLGLPGSIEIFKITIMTFGKS